MRESYNKHPQKNLCILWGCQNFKGKNPQIQNVIEIEKMVWEMNLVRYLISHYSWKMLKNQSYDFKSLDC